MNRDSYKPRIVDEKLGLNHKSYGIAGCGHGSSCWHQRDEGRNNHHQEARKPAAVRL